MSSRASAISVILNTNGDQIFHAKMPQYREARGLIIAMLARLQGRFLCFLLLYDSLIQLLVDFYTKCE